MLVSSGGPVAKTSGCGSILSAMSSSAQKITIAHSGCAEKISMT
jgi:hypothetical protein